jgi:hypothetical protein
MSYERRATDMERRDDESRNGKTARYRLGGNVHWIQARKAWEDPERWIPGVLLAIDGDTATVRFVDESDLAGGIPPEAQVGGAEDDGEMARGAFQIEEASLEGLPVGELVWVTERWGILAFADEDGNAFALRPASGMAGTIFVRAGVGQLRFLLARFIDEIAEPEDEPEEELEEFVYGTVTGLDMVERFFVVPRNTAEDTAQVVDVVTSCTTWGEVREMASDEQYCSLLYGAGFDETDPPEDGDRFDPNEVDGLQSVEYPMTHEVAQELYLPNDLLLRFGEVEERFLEGRVWTIPVENGPSLVVELERRGHKCTEDVVVLAAEHDRFEWTS